MAKCKRGGVTYKRHKWKNASGKQVTSFHSPARCKACGEERVISNG